MLPTFAVGCKKDEPPPPQKVAPLEPIPAPDGLLADVFVPNPDAAWGHARAAIGGPLLFLPNNASNLAATLLGFPLTASAEIDGNVPVVAALVERKGGGRPRAALGLHVRDAGRLTDALVKGENARFRTRVDEKTSVTILESKDGGARPVATGLLGNYLLVAQTLDDVLDIGPYVARTLPGAKMPTGDLTLELPREALGGPIEKGLRSSWESLRPKQRGDRSPDDKTPPPPAPSPFDGVMEALLGILVDLDHARVTLDFDERAAHLRLTGSPRAGSPGAQSVADMAVADPSRLLELPSDTDIALFLHDSDKARLADAKRYADALADAIGKDTPAEDRAALSDALVALAEARGDTFTAGVSLLSTGPAAYARSDVTDEAKLGDALTNLLGLAKRKSVAAWLGQNAIDVKTDKTVLENLPGDIHRIRLTRLEAKEKAEKQDKKVLKGAKADNKNPSKEPPPGVPSTIDVLYMLGKDGLVLAAGYDAKAAFRAVHASPGGDNLGGRADAKAAIASIGGKAAFVALVEPLRILHRQAGKAEAGPSAPILFVVGKGGEGLPAGDPFLRIDVANAAIQELVKRRGAL